MPDENACCVATEKFLTSESLWPKVFTSHSWKRGFGTLSSAKTSWSTNPSWCAQPSWNCFIFSERMQRHCAWCSIIGLPLRGPGKNVINRVICAYLRLVLDEVGKGCQAVPRCHYRSLSWSYKRLEKPAQSETHEPAIWKNVDWLLSKNSESWGYDMYLYVFIYEISMGTQRLGGLPL